MNQFTALLLTVSIEVPLVLTVVWGYRRWSSPTETLSLSSLALVVAAASLVTHPFAWFVNDYFAGTLRFALRAAVIEAGVVLAETLILRFFGRLRWPVAFTAALVANMGSFGAGLFWFRFLR